MQRLSADRGCGTYAGMKLLAVVIACLGIIGCATVITVDGFEVWQNDYDNSKGQVLHRASFDLGCDYHSLKVRVIHAQQYSVTQMGVEGCGQRAVYVYLPDGSGWALNSDSRPVESQPSE